MSVFYPKTEKSNLAVELKDVNVVVECGKPQYAINSDKIVGYEEIVKCGSCGKIITNDNHKYCTECGEQIREEVSSSQNTFKGDNMIEQTYIKIISKEEIEEVEEQVWSIFIGIDEMNASGYFKDNKYVVEAYYEDEYLYKGASKRLKELGFVEDNGDENMEEKIAKINTDLIKKSVMDRNVSLMVVEMQQNGLLEAYDNAKKEYPIETMALSSKYLDLHPVANILLTLRGIDDIVSQRYLKGDITSGDFDHARVWIGIHSYFYYEHIIEEIDKEEFFTEASMQASEKFLKE